MTAALRRLWHEPLTASLLSCLCLAGASAVILEHVRSIHLVREVGVPTAQRLGNEQRRLVSLRDQLEVAELQSALRGGAEDDLIRQFVLPAGEDLSSVVGVLEVLREHLVAADHLTALAPVRFGSPQASKLVPSLTVTPVFVTLTVTDEGLRQVLGLLDLAGDVSMGDALTEAEREQLLTLTERENPAGLPALEHLLTTPLLDYARDQRTPLLTLAESLDDPGYLAAVDDVLHRSRLGNVPFFLGGALGTDLEASGLWPLRFLTVETVAGRRLGGGRTELSLTLGAYGQAS